MSVSQMMLKSRELAKRIQHTQSQHIRFDEDRTTLYGWQNNKIYKPSQTGQKFIDDNSFITLVIGPYGSGKSSMCVHKIVRRACAMPRWFQSGRRRSRWAIVRNTSGELQSTTLQTWLSWFGDLGDINKHEKPILTYEHTFNDGHGIVVLELIFLALDRPQDVRKIKSLELTGVYLNELSELPENALSHFKGRVNGRYPGKAFCSDPYWSGIIADTNPPDEDHWIYKDFETKSLESYKIFHQPPGLIQNDKEKWVPNPNADNVENLSKDYYTKLAEGQTEGFIKVYCLGQYGLVESGKRVYPEYNDDTHSRESISAIQGEPIHLGWDFGLTPACVVFQFTSRGHMRVLKEYCVENMGIRNFAKAIVLPALSKDFPYCRVGESQADPSGMAGDDIMEELSCIGELNSLGIKTEAASTNDVDVRVSSVRFYLNTMIDGTPGFQLDRANCPILRKGFISGYHMKRLNIAGEDRYQDKPNKNKYSHPHDALQYGAMKFASTTVSQSRITKPMEDMFNPVFRWQ